MRLFFRYLCFAVPVGVFVCVIGQLIIANQMIIYSNELGKITARVKELEEQNALLTKKLVKQQSIKRVSYEAKRLGYIEAASYLAFTRDSYPVAIKR